MKKVLSLFTTFVLLISMLCLTTIADENIRVFVNSKELLFDVPAQLINGRTMVPMRTIFEALGAKVEWDENAQSINAEKNDTIIEMHINNKTMIKNKAEITLDIAPLIINGRTLVPVRAVAESLGVEVFWRGEIKTVSIYENKKDVTYTSLYNLNGKQTEVETALVDLYKLVGWGENADDVRITMYALDGRTINVPLGDIEAYKKVGWYLKRDEVIQTLYAIDGKEITVYKGEVAAYVKVGWYENKLDVMQTLYAMDGRTIVVYKSEVETYTKVGWYVNKSDVMQILYSQDGRTVEVFKGQVDTFKSVGWFELEWRYGGYEGVRPYKEYEIAYAGNVPVGQTRYTGKLHSFGTAIRIAELKRYTNSADGVSISIYWSNQYDKSIKYITFYVTPYNNVGDAQRCSIRGYSNTPCKVTGYVPKVSSNISWDAYSYWKWDELDKDWHVVNDGAYYYKSTIKNKYGWYDREKCQIPNEEYKDVVLVSSFDCVWYNGNIKTLNVTKVFIEYADGTTLTLSGSNLLKCFY